MLLIRNSIACRARASRTNVKSLENALLPPVYVLQSIERNTWMSLSQQAPKVSKGPKVSDVPKASKFLKKEASQHSYVIGFENREHALLVQRFAHELTKVRLAKHAPVDMTHVIEQVCGIDAGSFDKAGMAHVNADPDAHVAICKRQNINKMGCRVEAIPFDEFMSFPYERCLGIAILHDIVSEDTQELVFQSEVIDPIWDEPMFRHTLEQRFK